MNGWQMAINVDKLSEYVHYELIPMEEDADAWAVRILEGPYSETVLKYGKVEFDGTGKETYMKFNFDIIQSPDEDLVAEEDQGLQEWAGDILQDLIARGFETGATIFREKE